MAGTVMPRPICTTDRDHPVQSDSPVQIKCCFDKSVRKAAADGDVGGAQPHAYTAASTDRGTRKPRMGTGEQTESDRRE
jgi:hypothetical protein